MGRTYPRYPIVGVGAIIFKEDSVLLIKRKNPPSANTWSIPGGVVEIGETIREAIIREVKEELGLQIRPERIVDVIDCIIPDKEGKIMYHYVVIDFLCTALSGNPVANSDIKEFIFEPLNKLSSLGLSHNLKRVIEKAYRLRLTTQSFEL